MGIVTFATLDDLNASRERPLAGSASARAERLLAEASAKLQLELERSRIRWRPLWEAGGAYAVQLRATACAMVNRAMSSPLPLGISSQQQAAGPYSRTESAANPGGDVYILESERRTLGIGRGRVGYLRPHRDGRRP